MINQLHSLTHRPEKGWDPVPLAHALSYAEGQWQAVDVAMIDRLEQWVGGLHGKRVLDLGGGPGQFSIGFASRGALVTWHDVSRSYMDIVRDKAKLAGVEIELSLGYLEEARRLGQEQFDLVFSRGCWCYSMNDRPFAGLVYSLARPGGGVFIDTPISARIRPTGSRMVQYFLNDHLWLKVGHPHPPRGRIASLFLKYPIERMTVDYSLRFNDRVFFVKSKTGNA